MITHYNPDSDHLKEASITVVYGSNHFKIALPKIRAQKTLVSVLQTKATQDSIMIDDNENNNVMAFFL